MEMERFKYDNTIVRSFAIATLFWGIIGMLGAEFKNAMVNVQPHSAAAHQCRYFCVCG